MEIFSKRVSLTTVAWLLFCAGATFAQETQTVTITEPATVKVEDLFKQADLVAIVRVLSGDTEHYPTAVYKAEVLTPFKGAEIGDRIYFGPYIGYAVGGEYLAFLRRSDEETKPKEQSNMPGLNYGSLKSVYQIMYEGYSTMPINYVCAFDGKTTSQQCDYGIKVNTYQVALPGKIKAFPLESGDLPSEDNKWVRRGGLISFLEHLRTSK